LIPTWSRKFVQVPKPYQYSNSKSFRKIPRFPTSPSIFQTPSIRMVFSEEYDLLNPGGASDVKNINSSWYVTPQRPWNISVSSCNIWVNCWDPSIPTLYGLALLKMAPQISPDNRPNYCPCGLWVKWLEVWRSMSMSVTGWITKTIPVRWNIKMLNLLKMSKKHYSLVEFAKFVIIVGFTFTKL